VALTGGSRVEQERQRLAIWVANQVLPHEPKVRAWLRRNRTAPEDVDEVIQEAYCRLAMLKSVDHIDRPEAYFFSLCRNLLLRRLKRNRIVPITTIAEIESVSPDSHPSPEREVAGRIDYARLMKLINQLPERCRTIVRLRKIEGWSQREIAQHLATTEKAVEKQIWLGVKAIRLAWEEAEAEAERSLRAFGSGTGKRL
jgi:RNA polymerase sigma-70 factor (ECF subfamily)